MQPCSKRKAKAREQKEQKGKERRERSHSIKVSTPASLCCPEPSGPLSQEHEKVLVVNPTIKPGFKAAADVVMRHGICMFLMHFCLVSQPDGNGINNNLWGKQAHRRDQVEATGVAQDGPESRPCSNLFFHQVHWTLSGQIRRKLAVCLNTAPMKSD